MNIRCVTDNLGNTSELAVTPNCMIINNYHCIGENSKCWRVASM